MEGEGFQIGSMEMREDAGAMEKTCSKVKGAMEEKMGAMEKKMGAMKDQIVKARKRGMDEEEGAMEKTCSKVKGAMEEKMGAMKDQIVKARKRGMDEEDVQQQMGAMEKKMGAMEEEFVQQQMGAMEEKNCTMEEEFVQQQMIAGIGEMEYVRVHKLDDVPFVDPDAETQDPFAMTEESLTWSSGCAERESKWIEANHELLLSGTWKKKVRTINVGVQVGGEDVHVMKHPPVADPLDAPPRGRRGRAAPRTKLIPPPRPVPPPPCSCLCPFCSSRPSPRYRPWTADPSTLLPPIAEPLDAPPRGRTAPRARLLPPPRLDPASPVQPPRGLRDSPTRRTGTTGSLPAVPIVKLGMVRPRRPDGGMSDAASPMLGV